MSQPTDIAAAIDDLATVNDVAEILGVKPGTVRQHVHAGVSWLPAPTRIGGRLYWQRADLEGLAEKRPAAHRPAKVAPSDTSTS
jgi:hypothetical protein